MELAEEYGSFEKVGGYLGGLLAGQCLFCRTGTCYVHPNEFRCDECEAAGTALDFFAKMERITDQEAVPRLAMLVESGSLQRRRNEQTVLLGIMSEASRYYHHLLCDTAEGEPGREWLKEQGVTVGTREELYLGYFPHCRNGIQTELIELLVNRGYEPDIVQSAILPSGFPGILLPVQAPQGHCWGLLKSPCMDALLHSPDMVSYEPLWSSSLPGMQRLAPHRFNKLVYECPFGRISAGFYPDITDG
jgi:hypothetical protein